VRKPNLVRSFVAHKHNLNKFSSIRARTATCFDLKNSTSLFLGYEWRICHLIIHITPVLAKSLQIIFAARHFALEIRRCYERFFFG